MSDIIEILAVYVADGQRIREVRPDSQTNPKGIVVVFDDGAEDFHPLSVNSREEFVKLWQCASAFSRITWATIAP
jgi:hypothetical protein